MPGKSRRAAGTLVAMALLMAAVLGTAALLRRGGTPRTLIAGSATPPSASAAVPAESAQRAHDLLLEAERQETAGRGDLARDLLLQAVALDPNDAEVHYRLGALLERVDPERARAEHQAAKRLDSRRSATAVDAVLRRR